MLMVTIYIMAKVKNLPKGEWQGWGEIATSGRDAAWGLMLIIIILADLRGIFTPPRPRRRRCLCFLIASSSIATWGPERSAPASG